jgi:hypothetical protein
MKIIKKLFSISYPYKFGNKLPQLEGKMKISIPSDLTNFTYIYNNFIMALYEKDYNYLEGISEKYFYLKMRNLLENFKGNLFISSNNINDKNINTEIIGVKEEYNMGTISLDRDANAGLEYTEVTPKELKFGKLGEKAFPNHIETFKLYGKSPNIFKIKIIIKTKIDFETDLIISEGSKKEDREVHTMVLEEQIALFGSSRSRNIIVSDFDKLMNDNPLVITDN